MVGTTLDQTATEPRARDGWHRIAVTTAGALAVGHVIIGALYRDLDAIFIAVSFVVALGLLHLRRGTAGVVVLGLAAANVALWTVPATVANLLGRFGFAAAVVPGLMAVLAITALAAVTGRIVARRRGTDELAPQRVGLAGGVGVVLVLIAAGAAGGGTPEAQPGDLVLRSDRTAFSPTELVAEAGTVAVYLDNRDYFWHTFTVSELGVNLAVPVGAADRVTFDAPPGTYEFVCAIPGHDVAGMVGTLTVVAP